MRSDYRASWIDWSLGATAALLIVAMILYAALAGGCAHSSDEPDENVVCLINNEGRNVCHEICSPDCPTICTTFEVIGDGEPYQIRLCALDVDAGTA